jgi:hypothetical protein
MTPDEHLERAVALDSWLSASASLEIWTECLALSAVVMRCIDRAYEGLMIALVAVAVGIYALRRALARISQHHLDRSEPAHDD